MNILLLDIRFQPLLPYSWLLVISAIIALYLTFAFAKLGSKAIWRSLFFLAILIAALNPNIAKIKAKPQKDVAAIIIDNSSSMKATNRIEGVRVAAEKIAGELNNYPNLEVRRAIIENSQNGTILSKAIAEAFNGIEKERIAGVIYIGDGNINKTDNMANSYPIHQILVGDENEVDRRLEIVKAPISAPIGTRAKYRFKIVQTGDAPNDAILKVHIGAEEPWQIKVKVNQEFDIEIPIAKRGKIPIAFEAIEATNEISKANNAQALNIMGIAQNLKVLLVTGEPYEGARAWRNLLKSDPNIDLVHFTILRGPEDEEDEFNTELSLIPFPTDDLFFQHLDSFDLIVFDRFMRMDALPDYYMARVGAWIEKGGGFLVLTGPDELENNGIMATPLAKLMPITGLPKAIESEFKPSITDIGLKHPITKGFIEEQKNWGNWPSAISYQSVGDTLMSANGAPLLVTKSAGNGRVGVILSDKSWVWQRGYQGGGPFRALMARMIHWLLKDPELESEILKFSVKDNTLILSYEGTKIGQVSAQLQSPSSSAEINLDQVENDQKSVQIANPEFGLYRAAYSDLATNLIYAVNGETNGALAATFKNIQSTTETNGSKSIFIGRDGKGNLPSFAPQTPINFANPAIFGLKQNNYKSKQSILLVPILPPLVYALLLAILALLAWFKEGARGSRAVLLRWPFSKVNASD